MAGPFSITPLPNLRCSFLGIFLKKDGGWRIIYHLSAPPSRSVNDFIDLQQYSLRYCTIDSAIAILNSLDPHFLMGKIDLRSAFRHIPVRREDWHLLGIHWHGRWYVDKCLPFGLRSSLANFDCLATAIEWILRHIYSIHHIIHYQLHPAEVSMISLISSNILSDIALLTQPSPSSTHLTHTF